MSIINFTLPPDYARHNPPPPTDRQIVKVVGVI